MTSLVMNLAQAIWGKGHQPAKVPLDFMPWLSSEDEDVDGDDEPQSIEEMKRALMSIPGMRVKKRNG